MDFTLYRIDDSGAFVALPHGEQTRFQTEAEAVARAEELRGEAAALGDKYLPGFVVLDYLGDIVREIRDPQVAQGGPGYEDEGP